MGVLGVMATRVVAVVAAGLMSVSEAAASQPAPAIESDIKAAFLYNFAKYVSLPRAALAPGDPFRICVIADPDFVKRLDAIVAGESIDGHKVAREIPDGPAHIRRCQVLFVSARDFDRVRGVIAAAQGAPVLTVSDAPEFLARGGAIEFVREEDRIRFDVNLPEAQKSGLSISSRLLRVARRVTPPSSRE